MTPLVIEVEYTIGQIVYLKTDTQQLPAIVVNYVVRMDSTVLYTIIQRTVEYLACGFELSSERDTMLAESHAT